MSHKNTLLSLLVLSLVAAALLAGCDPGGGSGSGPPGNALVLRWVYSTSIADWAGEVANTFNQQSNKAEDGQTIWIEPVSGDAGQAVSDMLAGAELPAVWTTADLSWREVLHMEAGEEIFLPTCVSVAESPLVIAMWEPVARALGWPARTIGWLDVASLAADPTGWAYYSGGEWGETLRIGHTHPGLSDSGVQTLAALVYAAEAGPDRIEGADVEDPIVQASVSAFESAVAWFSADTHLLDQTMRERGIGFLNAAIMYENAVVTQGSQDPRLVAIYPFEGTFVARYPSCIRAGMDEARTGAAELFLSYLVDAPAQERALAHGLRPVNEAVELGAPIDPAYGADPDQPGQVFQTVTGEVVFALQALWQAQRKDVNLVMVLDISGSMEGDKLRQVQLSAQTFIDQMGDDDRLTVIVFDDYPRILIEPQRVGEQREVLANLILSMTAAGQTSLFDSIAFASEQLQETGRADTVNAMVVLTDGQDTASTRFTSATDSAFGEVVQASGASVYTIAYGDDADRAVMRNIAMATNGIAYEGDVSTIDDIYAEISAAFGGSLGIGR